MYSALAALQEGRVRTLLQEARCNRLEEDIRRGHLEQTVQAGLRQADRIRKLESQSLSLDQKKQTLLARQQRHC
jgi:hypothetical protein